MNMLEMHINKITPHTYTTYVYTILCIHYVILVYIYYTLFPYTAYYTIICTIYIYSIYTCTGDVIYSTVTFVDKNRDELPKEAGALLAGSSVGLIRDVFTALQV